MARAPLHDELWHNTAVQSTSTFVCGVWSSQDCVCVRACVSAHVCVCVRACAWVPLCLCVCGAWCMRARAHVCVCDDPLPEGRR